jgi:hypothetical protein
MDTRVRPSYGLVWGWPSTSARIVATRIEYVRVSFCKPFCDSGPPSSRENRRSTGNRDEKLPEAARQLFTVRARIDPLLDSASGAVTMQAPEDGRCRQKKRASLLQKRGRQIVHDVHPLTWQTVTRHPEVHGCEMGGTTGSSTSTTGSALLTRTLVPSAV